MKTVARRTVLRGFGGAAIALPFLDIMARPHKAAAQSAISKTGIGGQPKRFLVFFTPCGQGPDWLKNTNDASGQLVLAPSLSPLERHKNDILFVNGVDNKSALNDASGLDNGHLKPYVNLTTAMLSKGGKADGISIDQAIAKEIGGTTKFPSLQLGVQANQPPYLSYSTPGVGLVPLSDPQRVFTKLFTDFKTDPTALLKIQARRKSVLDGIAADYARFSLRMSGQDRMKVDVHLEAIRQVEKQLATNATMSGQGCSKPGMPSAVGNTTDAYVANGKAQMDLTVMAFACDLTRVTMLMLQGAGGNIRLPGMSRGVHDASHDVFGYPKDSNTPAGDIDRNKNTKWFAEHFAGFLDRFKSIAEPGGGSLLDNTVIYWCSEHSCGNHNYDRMPILVAGSGGGYFKTGRHVLFPSTATGLNYCQQFFCTVKTNGLGLGDLYVSFLNAMGVPATTFGDPKFCKGPLPNLTA